jgi:salicylate biosynthesis isochorismate synthase/menaquinone-specific isochorismate synthase
VIAVEPLLAELDLALAKAEPHRRVVSVTAPVDLADPTATVFASRLASDRWFCWEQPDSNGFAIATLGSAYEIIGRGERRFEEATAQIARVSRWLIWRGAEGTPVGAGPIWTGGFAFAPDGARSSAWSSLPPALLVLPEVSLVRSAGETFLTLTAIAGGNATAVRERLERRLQSLSVEPLPMLDPSPTETRKISSVLPPRHYEDAVAAGVERIRAGDLEKVVLAREVTVEAGSAHDPAAVFGALRELFPSCFCFCVGSPEAAFLAASPELLVRRRGAGVATVALAGSTRRSADPAIDDHLAEQLMQSDKNRNEHRIVSQRIARKLNSRSVWVEATDEPEVIKVANIQHLATPVHAQLADPVSAVDLAALLHPTPAVGGEPDAKAQTLIAELEEMDRGWYAAPVGWMDAAEDGEFCVALRSALLRDRTAHLYAGAGIVADSDPATELAETELKLEALLPLLSG